jgi:uncharacterized protein YmfQ (DUF2313 family)
MGSDVVRDEAYLAMLQSLLPVGQAWTRAPEANLTKLLLAVAAELSKIHGRADDLINESDPRTTLEMLADWEITAGLPDTCTGGEDTIQERRAAVVQRITSTGGQSRSYFLSIAAVLGYMDVNPNTLFFDDAENNEYTLADGGEPSAAITDFIAHPITIEEFRPFVVGQSQCAIGSVAEGNYLTTYGITDDATIRHNWRVNVSGPRVTWFTCGLSELGRDPLAKISRAADLECLLRRTKPAHTNLILSYLGV